MQSQCSDNLPELTCSKMLLDSLYIEHEAGVEIGNVAAGCCVPCAASTKNTNDGLENY